MRAAGKYVTLAALVAVAGVAANAQGVLSAAGESTRKATAPQSPVDPLNRDTPRDSIYNLLEACHASNFTRAAKYLDLSRVPVNQRVVHGPELARNLCTLLDRDTDFEVEQLSDKPEGNQADQLAFDMDRLASFQVNERTTSLYMIRENQAGVDVWVVSADSVQRIPQLSGLIQASPLEKFIPKPLVNLKLLGTEIWVWLALVVVALLLSLVSKILSRAAIGIAKPIAKRYAGWLQQYRLLAFTEPLRLLVSLIVFRACMAVIAPSALVREYLLKLLALLFILGAASLVMRIVDVASDQWISRLDPRQKAVSYSVLPLGVRFVKICIFCFAILVVLNQWGFNITAVLAGVGVGGLAVALAAQKTIENLFGGISVISDRPVLVGDVCQFGGQTGTVEDIGLRSTRIRTPERTVVTIPNSQFSTMTLENLSRRDRLLFHPTLQLRRNTPPEKIREVMEVLEKLLRSHPKVDPTSVPVRFTKVTADAFQLEIFSYVLTTEGDEFLRVQSELLLAALRTVADAGVQLAVPFQESIVVNPT